MILDLVITLANVVCIVVDYKTGSYKSMALAALVTGALLDSMAHKALDAKIRVYQDKLDAATHVALEQLRRCEARGHSHD